jgi:predicted nucleic acid-binding protein
MPATLHASTDPLPVAVTADTSFAVAIFNAADPGHGRAWALYERLRNESVAFVLCRPLLQIEYWSALRRLQNTLAPRALERLVEQAEDRLGGGQRSLRLRTLNRRDPIEVREFLLLFGERLLWHAVKQLDHAQVRLTHGLVSRSRWWIKQYGLNSQDALHVEIAFDVARRIGNEPHFATLDTDFDVVDGLHVWGRL